MRALVLVLAASTMMGAEWTPLFDGKTLDGWRVRARPEDRDKGFWTVRDGAITADSRGRKNHNYVWLMRDGEYGDFELRVEVRGFRESTGNSGVQVRSRWDEAALWLNGPQVDIHPPAAFRTGLIYDETREVRHWIFPSLPGSKIEESQAPARAKWDADGWNELRIVCRGTRIRTWLNGAQVADYEGKGLLDDAAHGSHGVGMKGQIALQLHTGDDLLIQFRRVEVRGVR